MQRRNELEAPVGRDEGALAAMQDALAAGDASRVDSWLQFGLANARFPGGKTPLMLAATHPDADAAAKMVDAVLTHGAELHASDDCKRDVLMHACLHGVHASVIERIMRRNEQRGKWQLAWWTRDRDGLDAVVLASKGGHGKLAAYLLDHVLDLDARPLENYPLKVLETALSDGNEQCALNVLESATMQRTVRVKAAQASMTRNPWQDNCSVFSCVDAAVKHNLAAALDAMMALNREDATRAVWYSLHVLDSKHSEREDANAEGVSRHIRRIGYQYRSDRVWDSLRVPVLLRRRGFELMLRPDAASGSTCGSTESPTTWGPLVSLLSAPWASLRSVLVGNADKPSGAMLAVHLATLPSPVFCLVVRFLVPPAAEEIEEIRFWLDARRCRRCERLCIPGECRSESSRLNINRSE